MTPKQLKKIIKEASDRVDRMTPREIELAKQSGLWFRNNEED